MKFALGVVVLGILIFLPAGTFDYWNAWLFMGMLFIPMFFARVVMMIKNPELLKKRLNSKEQQSEQNLVIKLSGLMFVVGFVIAGFNFRFQWVVLPDWVLWAGAIIFLFLSMSLMLGSIFSFAIFLTYPVIIAKRIRNEEAVLLGR